MNNILKKSSLIIMLCTLLMSTNYTFVSANSAAPPSLVILVNNPPKDLSISLISNGNESKGAVRRAAWEGYYIFYSLYMQTNTDYTLKVTTKDSNFEYKISLPLHSYNNVFTLDLSKKTLTPGKYPFRSVILVSIRLLLTLLIEGIVFVIFGFRQKKSWITFFAINVLTQGTLNIWLNNGGSLIPSYLIFSLIIGEFFVFIVEMIAFPLFIKEHKKSRTLIYAFTANLISLIAGGYIISILPV